MMQEIRVTCAADFVPLACMLLGYLPERSMVLLPQDPDSQALSRTSPAAGFPLDDGQEAGEALVRYAEVFGTVPMVAVVFGDDDSRLFVSALLHIIWGEDMSGVQVLRFEDGQVFERFTPDEDGVAVELQSHPITLAGIESGVQLRTRAELAALWTIGAGDAQIGAQIAAEAVKTLDRWEAGESDSDALRGRAEPVSAALVAAAQDIESRRRMTSLISPDEAAQFLAAAVVVPVRDEVLAAMARNCELGGQMSQVWAAVGNSVTGAQGGADAMVLAAFAAYLGGQGTTANIAVDAALTVDRNHSLGQLLVQIIQQGLPPHRVAEMLTTAMEQ